jgi:putative FmdB family regulatory protein
MPVYEFHCRPCNRDFELVLTVSEYGRHKIECPHCGGTKVERIWSRVFAVTSKKS